MTQLASRLVSADSEIIDVGANIGGTTNAFAQFVPRGQVVAIEPNRRLVKEIRQSRKKYGFKNIKTIRRAAFSKDFKILKLFVDDSTFSSSSSIYRGAGTTRFQLVRSLKIDSMRLQKLGLIKIDVEGAEFDVLVGAEQTIINFQPWIIFEILVPTPGTENNPMNLLEEKNYSFLNVNTLLRTSYPELLQSPGVFNILAIPGGKALETERQFCRIIGLGEVCTLEKGIYVVEVSIQGIEPCVQGIGLFNLTESCWEIYYETNIVNLKHQTNSTLPIYLENQTNLEIRFGLDCGHNHFLGASLFKVFLEFPSNS